MVISSASRLLRYRIGTDTGEVYRNFRPVNTFVYIFQQMGLGVKTILMKEIVSQTTRMGKNEFFYLQLTEIIRQLP